MNPAMEELVTELIAARFPHLRGAIHVTITSNDLLYEVSKGRSGLNIEVGLTVLDSPNRREIFSRMGTAAQQVHSGLTLASKVTAQDEAHV